MGAVLDDLAGVVVGDALHGQQRRACRFVEELGFLLGGHPGADGLLRGDIGYEYIELSPRDDFMPFPSPCR